VTEREKEKESERVCVYVCKRKRDTENGIGTDKATHSQIDEGRPKREKEGEREREIYIDRRYCTSVAVLHMYAGEAKRWAKHIPF